MHRCRYSLPCAEHISERRRPENGHQVLGSNSRLEVTGSNFPLECNFALLEMLTVHACVRACVSLSRLKKHDFFFNVWTSPVLRLFSPYLILLGCVEAFQVWPDCHLGGCPPPTPRRQGMWGPCLCAPSASLAPRGLEERTTLSTLVYPLSSQQISMFTKLLFIKH